MDALTKTTRNPADVARILSTPAGLAAVVRQIDAAPVTQEHYQKKAAVFFAYCKARGIDAPKRADVMEYREALKAEGKTPATIRAYLSAVRRVFATLAATGQYPDITAGVKAPKVGKQHKRDALDAKRARQLVDAMGQDTTTGARDHAIVNLMLRAGLRTCEIVRARIGDLRTIDGRACLAVHGKGRDEAGDIVPLTAAALDPIRDYLRKRGHAGPEAPLFAAHGNRNRGGRMNTRTVRRMFREATEAAGIDAPTITAHSCRHTAVTLALQGGATLQEVQTLARHRNIETTLIYAHNLDAVHNTAPEKIQF